MRMILVNQGLSIIVCTTASIGWRCHSSNNIVHDAIMIVIVVVVVIVARRCSHLCRFL
ncbi:hypothetical protein HanIR_Chr09g0404231 [Helianthus annuus]|nr:hypothetical protein HanIR_Chr09g0404231 [Helianthus annuus]